MLVTAIRNYGVERAERVARYAAARPHPYVAGFQLAGDEAGYPAGDFAEPYRIAADAGLGCSVHAGEWGGPESVRAALTLPVTRIGHGVRSIEDPALVDELAERGVVLECCPTSNVVLGIYPSYEEHPLRALRAAGVRVTLGSDDPPWFGASIGGEYAVCAERLGFGDDDLAEAHRHRSGSRILRRKAQREPNNAPHGDRYRVARSRASGPAQTQEGNSAWIGSFARSCWRS